MIPRIDTLNGGQPCIKCKHYRETYQRRDRFFGNMSEVSWCTRWDRKVTDQTEGQNCLFFRKKEKMEV